MPRFAPDGRHLYYNGVDERAGHISLSLDDDSEEPLTNLVGRSGSMGWRLDTDGQYLYFTWQEDLGDIWVMDVVTDEDS